MKKGSQIFLKAIAFSRFMKIPKFSPALESFKRLYVAHLQIRKGSFLNVSYVYKLFCSFLWLSRAFLKLFSKIRDVFLSYLLQHCEGSQSFLQLPCIGLRKLLKISVSLESFRKPYAGMCNAIKIQEAFHSSLQSQKASWRFKFSVCPFEV